MLPTVPTISIDPFDERFLADPYSFHDQIRDAGPVVRLESIGVYAMARFADVKRALTDHVTFCSGRGVGLSDFAKETPWRPVSLLLEVDPPLHDRTRSLMNRIVSLSALRIVRPMWEALAADLVDRLVAKRRFDAVRELSEAYPLLVFPETIGLRNDGREHLLTYAMSTFNAFGPRNKLFQESNARAGPAIQWVTDACRREHLKPAGWGMAVFEAADRGECTEEEAERLVRSFLSAGVDTTVNGIAHMVLGFASFPEEWSKLREKPALARSAFDESLRWDSTVQTFFRTSTREVSIGGTVIPAGSKVLLFLAAANRDPRQWLHPERFDIERKNAGHVGFGAGIHQCLGQMMARQEAAVVLAALMTRVRSIRLTGYPVRRLNNTIRAIESLPVEVDPA
jgi:4-methoxybenzoate monooxygenase (O-demethylating)